MQVIRKFDNFGVNEMENDKFTRYDGWLDRAEKEIKELKDENEKLRAVLKRHHQWHQDIGVVKLVHEDGKETELDLSMEYSDSSLCDESIEALR